MKIQSDNARQVIAFRVLSPSLNRYSMIFRKIIIHYFVILINHRVVSVDTKTS